MCQHPSCETARPSSTAPPVNARAKSMSAVPELANIQKSCSAVANRQVVETYPPHACSLFNGDVVEVRSLAWWSIMGLSLSVDRFRFDVGPPTNRAYVRLNVQAGTAPATPGRRTGHGRGTAYRSATLVLHHPANINHHSRTIRGARLSQTGAIACPRVCCTAQGRQGCIAWRVERASRC